MVDSTSEIPFGYCHCGCGQKTRIAPHTSTTYGWVKGQPLKYILHHQAHMRTPLSKRLWDRVSVTQNPGECWEWAGSVNKKTGYGQISESGDKRKMLLVHRVAYILTYGEIPNGLFVLHSCDNKKCCNPKHLFLGTQQDNMTDKVSKGRQVKGEQRSGHKLTEDLVRYIRRKYAAGGISQQELAKELNVTKTAIRGVVRRKTWKHIA